MILQGQILKILEFAKDKADGDTIAAYKYFKREQTQKAQSWNQWMEMLQFYNVTHFSYPPIPPFKKNYLL